MAFFGQFLAIFGAKYWLDQSGLHLNSSIYFMWTRLMQKKIKTWVIQSNFSFHDQNTKFGHFWGVFNQDLCTSKKIPWTRKSRVKQNCVPYCLFWCTVGWGPTIWSPITLLERKTIIDVFPMWLIRVQTLYPKDFILIFQEI